MTLAAYYAARAAEYERIYEKPERQADLAILRQVVTEYFRSRRVLEIACGTGYWTALLAAVAESVVATDAGEEVLNVAKAKVWSDASRVTFRIADAFDLAGTPTDFDAALAAFWFSHVRRQDWSAFLTTLHSHLALSARVMLIDNRFVEGSNTPIARTDAGGNTYQQRTLDSGTTHEVLKNFPTPTELRRALGDNGAEAIEIVELPHYWYATYHTVA